MIKRPGKSWTSRPRTPLARIAAVGESPKRVAILGCFFWVASVSSTVWAATPTFLAEPPVPESASLDELNDYDADETLEAEAVAEEAEEETAEENDAETSANALSTNGLAHKTHDPHGEHHGEDKGAFQRLLDKTEFGATVAIVGQQSDYDAEKSGIDASMMVELEAGAELTERDAVGGAVKVGMGDGLGERIPSFCGLNAAGGATRDVYLNQLWYERKFGDGDRWRARIGYVDLTSDFDANAYANDEYCQFLSDAFVNNLTFDCPENALGGYVWWEPNDKWCFGAGYAESDRDCRELFSGGVVIGEINRRVDIGGLQGTYRGYFTANFGPHEALDGSDDDLTNDGWGLSFDQEISQNVGLWGRYGQQNGECNEFDRALTGGFQLHAFSEARPNDILGFGYGISFVSDEFKALNENAVDENHFELYYTFQVNEYFAATPSLQWIDGVGGDGESEVVWAPGLRATVAF